MTAQKIFDGSKRVAVMNLNLIPMGARMGAPAVRFVAIVAIGALVAMSAPEPGRAQATQAAAPSADQQQEVNLRRYVPTTVTSVWREVYAALPDPTAAPQMPGPKDIEGWRKAYDSVEQPALAASEAAIRKLQVSVSSMKLGGVPVLEVKPKDWAGSDKVLIYTHGGAYTLFSARSSLPSAALVGTRTGLRVISVDYTTAPHARWQEVTDQVVAVFTALRDEGVAMKDIAIYGDSAGGGLAAGAVLKLRDAGLGMPAAVVLWSPWADITETGDTYATLRDAEPIYLYDKVLGPSADAYADRSDQINPYVSPVYADFTKGFPPTLIQGGTREIFLSNFVRLYRALDTAGQVVTLDIYEGMPHVFPVRAPESPESVTALEKMNAFLAEHLTK